MDQDKLEHLLFLVTIWQWICYIGAGILLLLAVSLYLSNRKFKREWRKEDSIISKSLPFNAKRVIPVLDKLKHLYGLPENWNTYDSAPVSSEACIGAVFWLPIFLKDLD